MKKLTKEQLKLLNQKITGEKRVKLAKDGESYLSELAILPYEQDGKGFYHYRTLSEKAAKLGCFMAVRKPFADRSTETAVLAMLTFMEINGKRMVGYQNDIEVLTGYLESGDLDEARRWLIDHLESAGDKLYQKRHL